ncbi:uncharacterized protein LOC116612443 [Nematostella vectensis]|uniref:uncharacterized protein LOC116612443 n=1 Tax=Nematostella vectensis TaxID=45351 RepID=UPI0020779551|nr:uncharacterized protein LOC116612443 [Nematostella vectensis]
MNAYQTIVFFVIFRVTLSAVVNIQNYIALSENQKTGLLQIVFDEAIAVDNVNIVCGTLLSTLGSTQISFSNTTALVTQTRANVPFSVISAGQPVPVQCFGESIGNSNQFVPLTSKGNISSVQVTKAPVVSVCSDDYLVDTSLSCQSVKVQLSERVEGFPVVVTCSPSGSSAGSPQLKFEPAIANVGDTEVGVPFIFSSHGATTQRLKVVCKAQTYNVTIISNSTCGKPSGSTPTTPPPTTAPANVTVNTTQSSGTSLPTVEPMPDIVLFKFNTSLDGVSVLQYLLDTSSSLPVTFHTPELSLRPPSVTIYGSYAVSLALSIPQRLPLDVECSLASARSQANVVGVACPSNPLDTVTTAGSSVQLKLATTEVQFKRNEVLKTLLLTITGSSSSKIKDLVVLTCCPKAASVPVPPPVRASLFLELSRQQNISWGNIQAGVQSSTSPLDIDLTCPCDLEHNGCDIGCCCDRGCTDSERASFTCMSGFFGGASSERPFEFSCQAVWPDSTDWQPFMCVTTNNSPFLGYFYNFTSPSAAVDTLQYNSLLNTNTRTRYSYQAPQQTLSSSVAAYTVSTSVKTAANSKDANYLTASLGILTLPESIFNGVCSQLVPVRFLENRESVCVTQLTESLCSSSSIISASSYLMSRGVSNPTCPVPPAVLKGGQLSTLQDQTPILADDQVEYFCTDDATGAIVNSGAGVGIVETTGSSLFSVQSSNASSNKNWRCAFDDGRNPPLLPSYNSSSRICSNVVLNVSYQLEWSGQQINKIKALLVMGQVHIQPASISNLATSQSRVNSLTQRFSVKFVHFPGYNVSNTGNIAPNASQRSGNPGYQRGLPLLAAMVTAQSTTPSSLSLWSPAGDSLCTSSSNTGMLYGSAISTGCLLRLTLDDMRNCSQLRDLVRANQEALVPATHVGRSGNADVSMSGDWLPILREPDRSGSPSNGDFPGQCSLVPAGLTAEILVSEAGKTRGVSQMEIVGFKLRYQYTTWNFFCVSGFGLGCLATNASTNGSAISNSTVTPTNVTVNASVTPSGDNASVTQRNYAPRTQYFELKSTVVFIRVPSTDPARVKKSLDQSGLCREDVCKEELFYPLSPAYQGEAKEKVVAFSLSLIFMALVTFAFTRPWG